MDHLWIYWGNNLKKGKQWNRIHMVGSIGAIHSRNQSVANDFIDNRQYFFSVYCFSFKPIEWIVIQI